MVVVVMSWAWPRIIAKINSLLGRSRRAAGSRARTVSVTSAAKASTNPRVSALLGSINWIKMFRAMFMVLFIAYPSVSVKIFRMFNCTLVDGSYWLTVDMRLQCFTSEWLGYAVYAGLMGVVYVVGMPVTIVALLYKRRDKLFGPGSEANQRMYGFLYDGYGPTAWFWDAEELVRKLLLTAIAVLMDDSNPLQVRWCIGSCVCSLVRSLIRWFAGSLVRWFVGSLRLILAMTCCCFTGVVSVVNENATSHVSCR